jgi:signal transduction histidine kinase
MQAGLATGGTFRSPALRAIVIKKFVASFRVGLMQQESIRESDQAFPIVVANVPPTPGQRKVALGVIGLLLIGVLVAAPFAGAQARRVDAFVPVLQTVLCLADLITASLLFVQYSIQPQHAILVIASGYMCSGLFALLQTLAFPGGYAPAGLIGDGLDTPAWFFVLWHTTFPIAVIVYALSKRMDGSASAQGSAGSNISVTILCVLAIVALLTSIVTVWVGYLPSMYPESVTRQAAVGHLVNLVIWFISVTALVVLFFRQRSLLDLWLMVTLVAWMPNFIVAIMFEFVRFSVGWYLARGYALIASCTVLIVLLTQTTVLYARLAATLTLLRRERANRLMSVDAATAAMAHEVRQPLTGITTRGSAALNWLNKAPPDLEKVRACIEGMIEAARRGDTVISSIRGLMRKRPAERTAIRINDFVRQVLNLSAHDLQAQDVAVTIRYQDGLPEIHGDRTLLQQVLLNLVRNAIEAMAVVEPRARHLCLTTKLSEKSSVLILIGDSGCGVPAVQRDRLFDPFVTSKPSGMGLGLSICRTIVEDHGGELRLVKTDSRGSIFEVALPFNSRIDGVGDGERQE